MTPAARPAEILEEILSDFGKAGVRPSPLGILREALERQCSEDQAVEILTAFERCWWLLNHPAAGEA